MLDGKVSEKTLANWRSLGKGPDWEKLGKNVVYHLSDIVAWRKTCKRTPVNS